MLLNKWLSKIEIWTYHNPPKDHILVLGVIVQKLANLAGAFAGQILTSKISGFSNQLSTEIVDNPTFHCS